MSYITGIKINPPACRCCNESLEGEDKHVIASRLCDECYDAQQEIRAGRFHDPDLLARDREEGMFA